MAARYLAEGDRRGRSPGLSPGFHHPAQGLRRRDGGLVGPDRAEFARLLSKFVAGQSQEP
jgi:hypothetical protein